MAPAIAAGLVAVALPCVALFSPAAFSMQGSPAVEVFFSRGRGSIIARRHSPVQIPLRDDGIKIGVLRGI
jgi:hypothetical protein